MAAFLKENPSAKLIVIGHTDGTGEEEYNKLLSLQRAQNAKRFLVEVCKIAPETLSTQVRGAEEPAADNKTRDGRAQNRRVEFIVVG